MEKNGMIVNDECNEAEDIIAKWDEGDKSQSGYHLTILPTQMHPKLNLKRRRQQWLKPLYNRVRLNWIISTSSANSCRKSNFSG